ncbi:hypothetical protein IWQ62_005356 [Dispira parvispora]|uniref:Velvet domain-containing protein n=1 Tax=Dispira parvispora TaxID=1520584 RepID=A0A9W8AMC9_9FUNG|nr:hypothetical protein IWQ62_005356 [Dispira parvispora]
MFATLTTEDGRSEIHMLPDYQTHIIRGSVVSSIYYAKDTDNVEGAFFVFPDISIRVEGTYCLKFSLFEIVGNNVYFCQSVLSSPFTVYSAKKFPGMDPSTSLSQTFAKQGLKVRMRSENRRKKGTQRMRNSAGKNQPQSTPNSSPSTNHGAPSEEEGEQRDGRPSSGRYLASSSHSFALPYDGTSPISAAKTLDSTGGSYKSFGRDSYSWQYPAAGPVTHREGPSQSRSLSGPVPPSPSGYSPYPLQSGSGCFHPGGPSGPPSRFTEPSEGIPHSSTSWPLQSAKRASLANSPPQQPVTPSQGPRNWPLGSEHTCHPVPGTREVLYSSRVSDSHRTEHHLLPPTRDNHGYPGKHYRGHEEPYRPSHPMHVDYDLNAHPPRSPEQPQPWASKYHQEVLPKGEIYSKENQRPYPETGPHRFQPYPKRAASPTHHQRGGPTPSPRTLSSSSTYQYDHLRSKSGGDGGGDTYHHIGPGHSPSQCTIPPHSPVNRWGSREETLPTSKVTGPLPPPQVHGMGSAVLRRSSYPDNLRDLPSELPRTTDTSYTVSTVVPERPMLPSLSALDRHLANDVMPGRPPVRENPSGVGSTTYQYHTKGPDSQRLSLVSTPITASSSLTGVSSHLGYASMDSQKYPPSPYTARHPSYGGGDARSANSGGSHFSSNPSRVNPSPTHPADYHSTGQTRHSVYPRTASYQSPHGSSSTSQYGPPLPTPPILSPGVSGQESYLPPTSHLHSGHQATPPYASLRPPLPLSSTMAPSSSVYANHSQNFSPPPPATRM